MRLLRAVMVHTSKRISGTHFTVCTLVRNVDAHSRYKIDNAHMTVRDLGAHIHYIPSARSDACFDSSSGAHPDVRSDAHFHACSQCARFNSHSR